MGINWQTISQFVALFSMSNMPCWFWFSLASTLICRQMSSYACWIHGKMSNMGTSPQLEISSWEIHDRPLLVVDDLESLWLLWKHGSTYMNVHCSFTTKYHGSARPPVRLPSSSVSCLCLLGAPVRFYESSNGWPQWSPGSVLLLVPIPLRSSSQ